MASTNPGLNWPMPSQMGGMNRGMMNPMMMGGKKMMESLQRNITN